MKTKSLITVILLFAAGVCFAQESMFDKLSEQKDITYITITKALLNMLPDVSSSVEVNGVDVKKIADRLDQIDIYTSNSDKAREMMQKEITRHFKDNKSYEVLMKIKDDDDNIIFYGQKAGNFFTSLIMFVNNKSDKCVLIRLSGKFTTKDIQSLTKEN
jgi:hypothetical protein